MKTKGTVKDSLTVEHETYDTLTVCIGVVYCLSILFIQLITEITSWLLQRNNNSSAKPLATNHSPKKKGVHSTQPMSTIDTPQQKTQRCPLAEAPIATSAAPCVATGSLPEATTLSKRSLASKDGMMSQTLKTSKSGPSTQPARRRRATTSNQITSIAG